MMLEKDPKGGYLSEDGCWYEDVKGLLATSVLGFCGCGRPDETLDFIVRCMKCPDPNYPSLLDFETVKAEIVANPDLVTYVVLYLLDDKNLTEHGSSVPGWLTAKGEEFLKHYKEIE